MLTALCHATQEACLAAALGTGWSSKAQVASDFVASRLLKSVRLPNYNALRHIKVDCQRSRVFPTETIASGTQATPTAGGELCYLQSGAHNGLSSLIVNYRFNRGDLQSLKEVFLDQAYEMTLPFRPRSILDLGANIGLASLWFWRQYAAERIIAVEPDPANVRVAARNLADNGVAGEVLSAAVGVQTGTAWFCPRTESNLGQLLAPASNTGGSPVGAAGGPPAVHENSSGFSAAISVSDGPPETHTGGPPVLPGAFEVPVIGIAELVMRFGDGGVDLVKMDIEGAEGCLLGGDLSWLGSVNALVVEFHDDRVDSGPLIQRVEAAGFKHSRANEARQPNLSLFVRQTRTQNSAGFEHTQ